MDKNRCLILGAESVDSNSLNRCLANLYDLTDEVCSKSIEMTSDNIPSSPFFSGGYDNALTDIDYVSSITFVQDGATVASPITSATTAAFGVAERTYGKSLQKCLTKNENFTTETATGVYNYTEDDIAGFVPTVSTLFTDDTPLAFAAVIDDDTRTVTTGMSALGCQSTPTVKYTSYMVCGYTGISFGQITFKRRNSDTQNNVVTVNISRDLINREDVDEVKFFSVSNGYASGVRRVSENLDMVSDINACNVTYISDDDVVISNITKNDASDTIRIDKDTGRILDTDEKRNYGEYTEIPNDTMSLNFFVVFTTRKDYVAFDEGTWCFYLCDDYDYARKNLTKADSYARGSINYRFLGFEAADDGYEDYLSDTPHKVYDTIKSSKDAFRGCFNATFPLLSHFSSSYEYADRMFKDCHHATFDSLPTCAYLPRLKTAVSMFENCATADFAKLQHIHFPRSSKLTKMFYKCTGALFSELEDVNVNGSCGQMFYGDYSAEFKRLSTVTGGATVLDSMFERCSNSDFCTLSSIESSAAGVVRAYSMFSGLSANEFPKLERISLGTDCYNANGMFRDCTNATFASLTSIGEPQIAEYQFYGCANATFDGLSSLGSKLSDSQHMFQNCSSLNMEISADLPTLDNATEMFEHANSVVIHGDMNDLDFADRMCANMNYAVIYGDMDDLKSSRSMFVNTDTAYVYGSVDSLMDADSMFMNTGSARMAHVPHALLYMLNMFSNSDSCCVYDYQSAVARRTSETSVQNRISDSAFMSAGSVDITGNILAGDIESASNMFMNATRWNGTSGGHVRLFNPDMESTTDEENRYFYVGDDMEYTITRGLAEDGLTRLYSKTPIWSVPEEDRKDTFGLGVQITNDETQYTLYLSSSEYGYYREVHEGDYDYLASAVSVLGSNGHQYFFSEANFDGGTAWTVNQMEDDTLSFKFNVEVCNSPIVDTTKSTTVKYLEPSEYGLIEETVRCIVTMQWNTASSSFELGITPMIGSYVKIKDGFSSTDFSVAINYVVVDEDVEAVVEITAEGSSVSYQMRKIGTITRFVEFDTLMIGEDVEPDISAKLYQIYKDIAETSSFGFMIAMRERDSLNTKYYLYKGDYGERLVDFTTEQGDIYSLDVVLDGSGTDLAETKVSFGVNVSADFVSDTFIEADEMFRGVVTDSLLSGYDNLMSRSLTTTRGMFMLDEKADGDMTFRDTGRVFSTMDKTSVTDASDMFRNRLVCDPYAFYDYGNAADRHYALHIPTTLVNAESMFHNCTISADGKEIGLRIPSTLVNAKSMFEDFDGCLLRLGHNSNGSVVINGDLEYEGMFRNAHFANTERNNYVLTVPRVNMSIFRDSDFLFNSIDGIVETNGRYFAPVNMSDGQHHELDNTEKLFETAAEGGAELGSLDNDLSKWFDEGIYLATVLGPSGNEYRLQTEYLTGGRLRGHYRMADCRSHGDDRTEEEIAQHSRFLSLSATTRNFRATNMSEIRGERIASMFNPWIAINCSERTVGDGMVELVSPYTFESLPNSVESSFNRNYVSAEFNKVKVISTNEMPFAFSGLKSGVFANVKAISGGTVNAAGAFMNCPKATFSGLKTIDISDVPSVGVFESAYTDMTSASGEMWSGNYIDMFANDVSARFGALESVLVKSRFFRLYPINEHLDEGWYDFPESDGDTFEFGSRDVYYFRFLEFGTDGCASFAIADNGGNVIAEFRSSIPVEGSGIRVHIIEIGEYDEPCVEVRLSTLADDIEDIKDRWLVYRNGYVEGATVTNPDPLYYYSNYLLTYFTKGTSGGVLNFDVKHVKSMTSHSVFVEKDESGFLKIVFENNDESTGHRRTEYVTDIPSDVEFALEEEFGDLNAKATTSELDYQLVVIVMINVGGAKMYYTAKPLSDVSESGPEFEIEPTVFHPAANDVGNTKRDTIVLSECEEKTILFGKKEYIIKFRSSGSETYSFTVCDADDTEIASFDTDVSTSDADAKLELLETEMYNDEVGMTEDALVLNFVSTSYKFVMFGSGTVEESRTFPDVVRYRFLCRYADNEYYLTENASYCDGMFMNCTSASFMRLKTVSLAGIGSCAKMFANCTNAKISGLEALYLPEAYTDVAADGTKDGGEHCYFGIFEGCNAENIDLSSLDAITTNIHTIGYGTTKTNGKALFHGMTTAIESADDALNYLGLKKEIGDRMKW